jgi:uncharacterized membrane protein YbaN (DUF454 family)
MRKFEKKILIAFGTFFLGIGVIGIFLPLLPTTPFLLLSAACYARSSKRLYDRLMSNRYFGRHLKDYIGGKGISLKLKIFTLSLFLMTIAYSVIFIIDNTFWRMTLLLIGAGVSVHILAIKTKHT